VAIVVGTVTNGTRQFNNGRTFAVTVDAGDNRVLLVHIMNSISHAVTWVTYNAVPMTQLWTKVYGGANHGRATCYYLLEPDVGVNNVAFGLGGNCNNAASAQSWSGVDPDVPFGVPVTATAVSNTPTVNVASEADEVVVDAFCCEGFGGDTCAVGAAQTEMFRENAAGGVNEMHGSSYEPGAALVTMSWTLSAVREWGIGAVALKPIVDFITRPVEYTLDAWDHEQRILDSAGHDVPRYKIKPNNWCRIVGLESTTAEVYTSNYEDPTLVYFESVSYDGETDEVQIVTNRGDLPEVIMARLATGSTG